MRNTVSMKKRFGASGERDMTKAKLLIIKHPNTDMVEIQTTDRLCEYRYAFSPPADEELSPEFIAFRNDLRGIHGLDGVNVGRHSIHLERYEVFEWDDLIPQAVDALKKFTGSEYETTVVDRSEPERRRRGPDDGGIIDNWDEEYTDADAVNGRYEPEDAA